jgi:hypothetical protein
VGGTTRWEPNPWEPKTQPIQTRSNIVYFESQSQNCLDWWFPAQDFTRIDDWIFVCSVFDTPHQNDALRRLSRRHYRDHAAPLTVERLSICCLTARIYHRTSVLLELLALNLSGTGFADGYIYHCRIAVARWLLEDSIFYASGCHRENVSVWSE